MVKPFYKKINAILRIMSNLKSNHCENNAVYDPSFKLFDTILINAGFSLVFNSNRYALKRGFGE